MQYKAVLLSTDNYCWTSTSNGYIILWLETHTNMQTNPFGAEEVLYRHDCNCAITGYICSWHNILNYNKIENLFLNDNFYCGLRLHFKKKRILKILSKEKILFSKRAEDSSELKARACCENRSTSLLHENIKYKEVQAKLKQQNN